ncbi:MAG: choice-of-anchor J domain-containing protein, partial [Flavobacteriales bacterium]
MKKNYFLLSALLMFLSVGILNAQVSLYSFSAKPGTFTPIVGGTNLNSVDADDAISSPQPIGFTFNFDGSNHTQFRMSSNGFISFGSSTSSLSGNNLDFAGATSRPLIAPLWDDLSGSTNTKASYLLSGTAPNRILTVEWLNWQWRYNSADSAISFQVKLYETSNKVEFVYQQGPNPINSPTASIGLSGVGSGNGSYMSLENTGIFPSVRTTGGEISNLNTKPANGQVYIFEPPTCTPPSGLSASGITLTDATISWTAASAGWYYSIEYGPAGFTPGTGMTDTTRDTSINLTGLVGSTSYDVYVKSYCNLLDSSLSISFSFQTACAAVSSFPYKETFDGSSTTEVCWSVLNNNGDADQWNLNYTTNPFAGDQVAMMYTDFNSGNNDDYLISPQFVLTGNQRLKFQTRVQSSGEPNDYEVVLSSTGTSPSDFSTLILKDTVSSTTYNEVILDLSSYTGSYYIAIKIPNGGLDGWRLYIDDFIVEDIPTCLVPTALTSTNVSGDTADISWTDNNTTTPGSWQVSYGLQGFTVGTGTQVTMTADSGTLSGLMGSSDYDWYVRAICGSGDTSAWSSVGTFTTLCP